MAAEFVRGAVLAIGMLSALIGAVLYLCLTYQQSPNQTIAMLATGLLVFGGLLLAAYFRWMG